MKKVVLFLLIFILFVGLDFGYQKKFQVSLFGGLSRVLEYGSENDYVWGENDFPVTPAHTPPGFGAALVYFFTNTIGIELEGRYTLPSRVTLTDPSDQDTVRIDTSEHYSVTLNFIYQFLKGKVRPYLVVGGGIDKLSAQDKTYTSEYGYEIEFLAPEKMIDPVALAGAGIHYFLSQNIGLGLDFRYVLIFDEPNNVSSLNVNFGFFLRF